MMNRTLSRRMFATLTAVALLGVASHAHAARILASGNSMDQLMNPNSNLSKAISGLGHTVTYVPPSQFKDAPLSGYDAVWLDGFSLFGTDLKAKLGAFINLGGNVFVENAGLGGEPLSTYPLGAELTRIDVPDFSTIRIVLTLDPVNAGLTGQGLSGWSPSASASGYFENIGAFRGVTDTGVPGQWVTIARRVNWGNLVYTHQHVSQFLRDNPFVPGSNSQAAQFLHNVVTLPHGPLNAVTANLEWLKDGVFWEGGCVPACDTLGCVPACDTLQSALVGMIQQASGLFAQGAYQPAIDYLRRFVRYTERLIGQRQIPEDKGESFIAQAEALIAQIEVDPLSCIVPPSRTIVPDPFPQGMRKR
jgi:hypothetical protein